VFFAGRCRSEHPASFAQQAWAEMLVVRVGSLAKRFDEDGHRASFRRVREQGLVNFAS
jgi:hypothetical protein